MNRAAVRTSHIGRFSGVPAPGDAAFYLSVHPRNRRFQRPGKACVNKPSPGGREQPGQKALHRFLPASHRSGSRRGNAAADRADQVAPRFAVFPGLRGLALTGFRDVAGLMLSGLPALTEVTSGAGSRKYTRQPGES
jgi:hypothetical protein